jgi:hypothetical protein
MAPLPWWAFPIFEVFIMGRFIDLTGMSFSRLTVLSRAENSKGKHSRWLCQCECGNITIVQSGNLRNGHTRSCGCLLPDTVTTHGLSQDKDIMKEYHAWEHMRFRCLNETDPQYADYGGRGISICKRWDDFSLFLEDMGKKPGKDLSIDRKDNNGDYEPSNCKWSTSTEQSQNSRNSRAWIIKGKRFNSLNDAAIYFNVAKNTIAYWCGRHHLNVNGPKPGCYSVLKYEQEVSKCQ